MKEERRMNIGELIVDWGSMYSGKSEALIHHMKMARYEGKNCMLFKPAKDDRYEKTKVVTHTGENMDAFAVNHEREILDQVIGHKPNVQVVGIDEGQFFGESLPNVVLSLKMLGINVFVSGLDMKFNCEPFPVMSQLATIANQTIKHHAVCVSCHKPAYVSHRTVDSNEDILVGSEGMYIALCEECHVDTIYGREERNLPIPGQVYKGIDNQLYSVLSMSRNLSSTVSDFHVICESEEGEWVNISLDIFLGYSLVGDQVVETYKLEDGMTWSS